MNKKFAEIFTQLHYTKKEAQLFLEVYKHGSQPASTIAKRLNLERTWVYKTLRRMAADGLIQQTKQKWVSHFFVTSSTSLLQALEARQQQLKELHNDYDEVESRLTQFDSAKYPHLPKISLYDSTSWIKSLYQDIYNTVIANNYLVIKFFASNTFESQTTVNTTLKSYYQDIFQQLKKKKVTVDTYLGNGILIMEQITRTTNIENLSDLPAGNSAVNIFVVGKVIYLIIFKDIPFGIKIDSEDVANTMHFLFEKLTIE